ncbi:hypothetical protein D3C81_2135160 [compost metagenome]
MKLFIKSLLIVRISPVSSEHPSKIVILRAKSFIIPLYLLSTGQSETLLKKAFCPIMMYLMNIVILSPADVLIVSS